MEPGRLPRSAASDILPDVVRRRERPGRAEVQAFVERVDAECARLGPQLPDVDPGDLRLILGWMLRPPEWGRRFLARPLPGGGHVF